MSKYDPLYDYLSASPHDELNMTFDDIEDILGSRLPDSAYRYPEWWSNNNQTHVQTNSWLEAGYHTKHVDIPRKSLVFYRYR